ncbi:hypothetical protein C7H79_12395 [Nitrosomonas supralitoralis]|uniref:Uncharacterized protein n=1 Tax=Nitrosomonas supralitoralis TaxID=2116706 RepID=A0A2P7NT40_9PROT|nr:hypothetical protein C7H79_12395 [Nitrosomonas supralitoralis]
MKNIFEAAYTEPKQAIKCSLCLINEHFEPVVYTVAATQIVFQRPARVVSFEQMAIYAETVWERVN